MPDDTNIDDILKSIDALLKESEELDALDAKRQRSRHEATNDDGPLDAAGHESGIGAESGTLIDRLEPEAPQPVAVEPEKVVKRILLSEDMLVEDTPDLLAFAEENDAVEAFADDACDGEGAPDEPVEESVEISEVEAPDVAAETVPPAAVEPSLDTELLIEAVSREVGGQIAARLQEMLPGMIAESVRRHIAARQAAGLEQGETEHDTKAD